MSKLDDYGYFGPNYSFADNIPLPGAIGVRQEASIGAIIDSIGGINYYVDTIAFGGPTFFDHQNPQPMGLRYFLNTDMRCSNGATMSQYVDGVTKGDIMGSHVAAALASTGLPGLKGLAPGMLENARDALDPRPIFAAVTGSGYPVCQQVTCLVGDQNGLVQNIYDPEKPYIVDSVHYVNGYPTQKRWVQAYDKNKSPINVTKDEFGAAAKCYNSDGSYQDRPPPGCPPVEPAQTFVNNDRNYPRCWVNQTATLPPTIRSGSGPGSGSGPVPGSVPNPRKEGFDGGEEDAMTNLGTIACIAVLGSIAFWGLTKKR